MVLDVLRSPARRPAVPMLIVVTALLAGCGSLGTLPFGGLMGARGAADDASRSAAAPPATAAAAVVASPVVPPGIDGAATPLLPPAAADDAEVRRSTLARHIANQYRRPEPAIRRIVDLAFEHAARRRLPPLLVVALIARESSFLAEARSAYGALGLMQVVPRFHPEKLRGGGTKQLFDPDVNIDVGTWVLADYLKREGGAIDRALKRYSGDAPAYVSRVVSQWVALEGVFWSVPVVETALLQAAR